MNQRGRNISPMYKLEQHTKQQQKKYIVQILEHIKNIIQNQDSQAIKEEQKKKNKTFSIFIENIPGAPIPAPINVVNQFNNRIEKVGEINMPPMQKCVYPDPHSCKASGRGIVEDYSDTATRRLRFLLDPRKNNLDQSMLENQSSVLGPKAQIRGKGFLTPLSNFQRQQSPQFCLIGSSKQGSRNKGIKSGLGRLNNTAGSSDAYDNAPAPQSQQHERNIKYLTDYCNKIQSGQFFKNQQYLFTQKESLIKKIDAPIPFSQRNERAAFVAAVALAAEDSMDRSNQRNSDIPPSAPSYVEISPRTRKCAAAQGISIPKIKKFENLELHGTKSMLQSRNLRDYMTSGLQATDKNPDKNTDTRTGLQLIGCPVKKSPRKQLSEKSDSEQVKIAKNNINAYRDSNASHSSPTSKIRIDPAEVNSAAFPGEQIKEIETFHKEVRIINETIKKSQELEIETQMGKDGQATTQNHSRNSPKEMSYSSTKSNALQKQADCRTQAASQKDSRKDGDSHKDEAMTWAGNSHTVLTSKINNHFQGSMGINSKNVLINDQNIENSQEQTCSPIQNPINTQSKGTIDVVSPGFKLATFSPVSERKDNSQHQDTSRANQDSFRERAGECDDGGDDIGIYVDHSGQTDLKQLPIPPIPIRQIGFQQDFMTFESYAPERVLDVRKTDSEQELIVGEQQIRQSEKPLTPNIIRELQYGLFNQSQQLGSSNENLNENLSEQLMPQPVSFRKPQTVSKATRRRNKTSLAEKHKEQSEASKRLTEADQYKYSWANHQEYDISQGFDIKIKSLRPTVREYAERDPSMNRESHRKQLSNRQKQKIIHQNQKYAAQYLYEQLQQRASNRSPSIPRQQVQAELPMIVGVNLIAQEKRQQKQVKKPIWQSSLNYRHPDARASSPIQQTSDCGSIHQEGEDQQLPRERPQLVQGTRAIVGGVKCANIIKSTQDSHHTLIDQIMSSALTDRDQVSKDRDPQQRSKANLRTEELRIEPESPGYQFEGQFGGPPSQNTPVQH